MGSYYDPHYQSFSVQPSKVLKSYTTFSGVPTYTGQELEYEVSLLLK
jgi:hypothetical protein